MEELSPDQIAALLDLLNTAPDPAVAVAAAPPGWQLPVLILTGVAWTVREVFALLKPLIDARAEQMRRSP